MAVATAAAAAGTPVVLTSAVNALRDSVEIATSPERVWGWLTQLARDYREWHPDHVSARWVIGTPNQVGSVLEAVEWIGGHREKLRLELTAIDPPHRLEYHLRGPISLLLPGGSFRIEPAGGGSRFEATVQYRFGMLAQRLFKRRVAALQRHMREEGENLRRLLEAA